MEHSKIPAQPDQRVWAEHRLDRGGALVHLQILAHWPTEDERRHGWRPGDYKFINLQISTKQA